MKNLSNIYELESVMKECIKDEQTLTLYFELPDLPAYERITNPSINLKEKLAYYKKAYGSDLTLNNNNKIRIVGYKKDSKLSDIKMNLSIDASELIKTLKSVM